MKAITLHEPWASLIRDGRKTVETRDWPAPFFLVGERIAIHAGKKVDREFLLSVSPMPVHPGRVVATATLRGQMQVEVINEHGCGGHLVKSIVGRATTRTYIRPDRFGDFSVGRWLWILTDIQPLDPPILATGHQGFWNWDDGMGLFRRCECGHDAIRHIVGDDRMERCEDCDCLMYFGMDGLR